MPSTRRCARAEPRVRRAAARGAALLAALCLSVPGLARAEPVPVPVELQATLMTRVAAYDRGFRERAGDAARVLILVKASSPDSQKTGKAMASELDGKEIAGLKAQTFIAAFENPAALSAACRARKAAIVYLTPGLGPDLEAIGKALEGVDVLSVAAVPSFVGKGAVLGFDLVSGKPQMLVHLPQAAAQSVKLSPDVLRLMKVIK